MVGCEIKRLLDMGLSAVLVSEGSSTTRKSNLQTEIRYGKGSGDGCNALVVP